MSTVASTRATVVLAVIACLLGGMTLRVAYLQTYGRQQTLRSAERQQHQSETIYARRGSIFDANGNALAVSVQQMALYVDPEFMLDEYTFGSKTREQLPGDLARLAGLIDRKAEELYMLVHARANARYVRVAENLTQEQGERVGQLGIPGVGLEPMSVRNYPMDTLAAHVLGAVGKDGFGLEGIEMKYQRELAGKNGFRRVEKDARRRPIGVQAEDYLPPSHGQHLVLTIDANVQMIAEQELAEACRVVKAKRGEVIVMDPTTGAVLAMANWPTFSPQGIDEVEREVRRNRCVTDSYEPGSTLKPFIMGPALEWDFTRATEIWPIHGETYVVSYGRSSRRVSDVHFYGPLSSWDVLVKSSNIGMSMLAHRMGNANLYKSLDTFAFGRRTGIELPGEYTGLLQPLKKWKRPSVESVAQGYEMRVTPLQLARAFSAYANGGRLVQPTVVKGLLDAEGNVASRRPEPSLERMPRVIGEETANSVRQILSDTVVRGTATVARSRHWNIFGKTGTAHISEGKRGYSAKRYTSSFLCGAPYENPRIVVAFIVHEPDRSIAHYGGRVSGPGAMRLVERALSYMQVPPSPALTPPPPNVAATLVNYDVRRYEAPGEVAVVEH
jgi:cell division protein FtsI (penicillin-binding protein 3)